MTLTIMTRLAIMSCAEAKPNPVGAAEATFESQHGVSVDIAAVDIFGLLGTGRAEENSLRLTHPRFISRGTSSRASEVRLPTLLTEVEGVVIESEGPRTPEPLRLGVGYRAAPQEIFNHQPPERALQDQFPELVFGSQHLSQLRGLDQDVTQRTGEIREVDPPAAPATQDPLLDARGME